MKCTRLLQFLKIITSPVPLIYNRHVARFLSFWLLLVPFALYDPFAASWNHVAMVPATIVISTALFGIEELATQMEESFTILPMQAFCDKIGKWCNEIVSWEDGDNGITTKASYQGHSTVYFENLAVEADGSVVNFVGGTAESTKRTGVRSRIRSLLR